MLVEAAVDEDAGACVATPKDGQAPSIPVVRDTIICVEHPCIIRNLDRGIASLGGESAIDAAFEANRRPDVFEASLRPDDAMARTIVSRRVPVRNLLLKISVPKRTGCKRRKGSSGLFLSDTIDAPAHNSETRATQSSTLQAEDVLKSLRSHHGKSNVQVVGYIHDTHRFRSIPDYQYATSTNTVMQNLRDSILTTDLKKIQMFRLDLSPSLAPGQDVGPPPFFNIVRQPFNYSYRQNIYVKQFVDGDGNVHLMNTTAPVRHVRHVLAPDARDVPNAPPGELPRLQDIPVGVQKTVAQLKELLEKRPCMQRRVFLNMLDGTQTEGELKAAQGYCGYAFTSGPYRDTVIKLGIDPRLDPNYRIYQTVSYQIQGEGKGAEDDPGQYIRMVGGKRISAKVTKTQNSHIFDGTKFYKDGKVWQVCDITDPMLKELLDNGDLRSEPDMLFSGWYGNGTWAVFRRLMKYKIHCVAANKKANDESCRAIAAMFPSHVDEDNLIMTRHDAWGSIFSKSAYKNSKVTTEMSTMAAEIRSMAMAAYRYHKRHHQGRKTGPDGDAIMGGTSDGADGQAASGAEDNEDAELLGLNSGGDDDDDDDDNDEDDD